MERRILIVGTAGRDFHVFNTAYRDDPEHRVLGFTSAEVCPGEHGRYPPCLTGPRYPDGIPILPESELTMLIAALDIDEVVFAYSELDCRDVAGLAAQVLAAGADFQVPSPRRSMLRVGKPVIAVTASRAGSGKSPTVRYLAELLQASGQRVAVLRHPLRIQGYTEDHEHRYLTVDGVEVDACGQPDRQPDETLPGVWLFSGLDFAATAAAAESEADVIIWDGAGNDLPFLAPDLHIVLVDPLRAGEEVGFFPGEACLRLADLVIVSKCDAASEDQLDLVDSLIYRLNPDVTVLRADTPVRIDGADRVAGRTVVVVEDVLSLTLGAVRPGAGLAAAQRVGVSAVISPMPQAVGSLSRIYRRHPEAQQILPCAGFEAERLAELRATLEATPSEAVIDATRADLAGLLQLTRPVAKASFGLRPHQPDLLADIVGAAVGATISGLTRRTT